MRWGFLSYVQTAQGAPDLLPAGMEWWRGLLALVFVGGLLAALVVLLRKNGLAAFGRAKAGGIAVESVVPIGDRRSLLIVSVEGRRLLLGASTVSVSLLTELGPRASFDAALARSVGSPPEPSR